MSSSSDWDEIKRLAADLQKAQLSSTLQRLSERNCIEIVTLLIELKLIDVIFTTDGKEYLTQAQLTREIKDELHIHGGRINSVDLAKELNVDLSHINGSVSDIVRSKEVQLVSGHLISHGYLEKLAREINEKLQQQGQTTVGELSLQYDLPADLLLHNVMERYLGKIIRGRQDPSDSRTFYTEEFITRSKAKIRGSLLGLLKPTPVAVIINHCNLTDRLFTSLFDEMDTLGSLTGRQAGALYVPSCYTKAQSEWVTNFYQQNNYLEFDALTRLGISDPKTFAKRALANEELLFLKSCLVGPQIKERIETALDECIVSKSYVDIVSLLPSVLSDSDIEMLLVILLKDNSKSTVLFENTVFSNHYLESLSEQCNTIVLKRAEEIVKSGKYQQFAFEKQVSGKTDSVQGHVDYKAERRDERRRKAGTGKVGGGTQGRETKTKAVKKHTRTSKNVAQDSDSDDGNVAPKKSQTLEIVSLADVEQCILETLERESLDELVTPVALYLHGKLNQTALTLAKEAAEKLVQDASQSRKQTHSAAQDTINILINDIKLYEKGIKLFPSDQQPQFIKYTLKSLGGDVVSEFCKYAASQCNLKLPEGFAADQRTKIINDLSDEYMKPIRALNASLTEPTIEPFFQALDLCLLECGMILKKVDKKKDRVLIHNHKENLLSELDKCEDPALVLHLAVLGIFTAVTQNMLHASGRQVQAIISFLKTHLSDEERETLQSYHETVTKFLITSEEEERVDLLRKLENEMAKIKKIAHEAKKQ